MWAMLFITIMVAASSASAEEMGSFGVISPDMNECLGSEAIAASCFREPERRNGSRAGPLRISGEGHIGFSYDGDRFSPVHGLKINLEFGGTTDNGLGMGISTRLNVDGDEISQ